MDHLEFFQYPEQIRLRPIFRLIFSVLRVAGCELATPQQRT